MVGTLYDHPQQTTARLTRQLAIFIDTTFFALLQVPINSSVLTSSHVAVRLSASHALLDADIHALTD